MVWKEDVDQGLVLIYENKLLEATKNRMNSGFNLSDFDLGIVAGHGKFGKVFLAKEKKTDFMVALKMINKQEVMKKKMQQQIFYELLIHSKLHHKNILRMYTYFTDDTCIYFVLEYAAKGSLYSIMLEQKYKRFSEDIAAKYVYQTSIAIYYCHSNHFLHGDIKPENILIDAGGNVKLSDFGYAWPLNALEHRGFGGTEEYLSPELLKGKPYDHRVDHWSLGILMYELLVGRNPFRCRKKDTMHERILRVDIKFPDHVSRGARDLICRLATRDPLDRLALRNVMVHYWVLDNYLYTNMLM